MALATQKQIELLAEKLTTCADALHERLMIAIRNGAISRPQAQALLQDEVLLRQQANGLYIDAANCVVQGLEESQKELIDVIGTAETRIRTFRKIASVIDVMADLLVLAAAVYSAKPGPIVAALNELKRDVR
jgi:phage shock protein A